MISLISKGNFQITPEDNMTKIMIVDDDKGATALIETIIVSAGYEPVVVNESSKAMDVANHIKPDLILLDLMMPEPTGFQLCRIMRATPGYKFTPIIIITALDDTDSRLVAFGAGANDYLTKPFHVGDLLQKMKDFLE
jgi:PleD family two-component response regulator